MYRVTQQDGLCIAKSSGQPVERVLCDLTARQSLVGVRLTDDNGKNGRFEAHNTVRRYGLGFEWSDNERTHLST